MHLQKQKRLSDSSWLLQMRDLAPEEFVCWLIEWGVLALLRRQEGANRNPSPGH
ncbi:MULTISPECIES: hypothetical protein [unclassified Pseudomonas]|uniref:hypothetical protein n=1 Tax=unclassified Pseudomonas TaxID=196821 RepID=UPI001913FAB5|nr:MULTISPECIES: hypothetical protein [unclassified Pseudomonas]MBK5549090.1 hypothetical protein [Pseudomonas sp. TH03]MEB0223032.1 hypothetical protein [Pseudomonas sp. 5S1]MEB0293562.1 hypothetical protein [Pseudomonas sp. 10S4]WPX17326.1 hypothetical protein RHM58_26040 [Pseudomonas sp. 10S4]